MLPLCVVVSGLMKIKKHNSKSRNVIIYIMTHTHTYMCIYKNKYALALKICDNKVKRFKYMYAMKNSF